MQNQERRLIELLTADGNTLDIKVNGEGVCVGTLHYPSVSGSGANTLEAMIMAAARKKRFVKGRSGFEVSATCIEEYEYDYGHLESIEKPNIEGMLALVVSRTNIQVYFRSGEMHILTQEGMVIQGHGATFFQALADAVRKLKAYVQRNDIVYEHILADIEMYEQHYGEIV